MKIFISLLMLVFVVACQNGSESQKRADAMDSDSVGTVEQWQDGLTKVIDPESQPEIIGEEFEWSEGPVWVRKHQFLLFSDVPRNTIYKWTENKGVEKYLHPSGYTGSDNREGESGSNGLIVDDKGRLVLAQHGDRRIARMEAPLDKPKADFATVAGRYNGKSFNSPNDLVQHSSGAIYFTDPPYGLVEGMEDPSRELGFQGVYRVDSTGTVELLTDSLSRPNGLAFSPDEKVLYVSNSNPDNPVWMAYDVAESGDLTNGRVFYDARQQAKKEKGLPDGLKVDDDGYIYATGPGGIWIFSPDGEALGRIRTGEATSNCALGQEESMLYITADMYIMRIPLQD